MATEALKMLQKCFRESTLSRTQVFEWYKAFSEGREVIENFTLVMTSKTIKNTVLENHGVGITEIAENLHISYGSTQHILVNILCKKHVNARQ